ncbi:MAG: tetratricopeptide repeat protein [Sulfurihydrogenibium sp.]|nr:tetratricopeptide repeat protein [Sulfurihydrogenibium sp.]
MRKSLFILFLWVGFLTFKSTAFAEDLIDACWHSIERKDYRIAVDFGKSAVEKYPDNPKAYHCLGKAYYGTGELELAYNNLKKAETLAFYSNNDIDRMKIYNDLGEVLYKMGRSDEAFSYFDQSLRIAKYIKNRDKGIYVDYDMRRTLTNIAIYFDNKGELDKALDYYKEYLGSEKDEKTKADIYFNIGYKYYDDGNYRKAIEYFQKSIEINEKYQRYLPLAESEVYVGDSYRMIKDYENAEKYLLKGIEDAKKVKYKFFEAMGYWKLGRLYRDKGDKKTAKEYFTRAYNIFDSSKNLFMAMYAGSVLDDIKKLGE